MTESIQAKQEQAAQLTRELAGSLAIKELWPEAFDAGKVSTRLVDRAVPGPGNMGGLKREVYKIIVTNGAGESRSFSPPEALRGAK